MNYLNTITKTNVDRLIGLLDPDSGISVTRNVYPDWINPAGHVTHKYIVDTINKKCVGYVNHFFGIVYGSSENNAAIRIERVIEPVVETSNGLVTSEGGLESQAEGNSVSGVVPGGKDAKVKKTLASSKKSLGVSAA